MTPTEPAPFRAWFGRLAAREGRGRRAQVGLSGAMFAVAGLLFFHSLSPAPPPEPNFSGYYDGPWVNKSGELVGGDGTVLQEDYRGMKAQRTRNTHSGLHRGVSKIALSSRLAP